LVDLPGYGYARVSKKSKKTFQKYITDYFVKREQLVCPFVLIDIRHDPQKIDMEFMEWLGEHAIPFCIIFTKADKLKPKVIERQVNNYIEELLSSMWEEAPNFFVTSSSNRIGREEVLQYIDAINSQFFEATKK